MDMLRFINDYIFKQILGKEEHIPALLDLINAVLEPSGLPLATELRFLNTEQTPSAFFLKKSVLDIRALDNRGREFDVEVQIISQRNYATRSLYYWSQLYLGQLNVGGDYRQLHPVICINIVDFVIFPDLPNPYNCFMIKHKDIADEILTEDLVIYYLELPKKPLDDNKLADWITYLKNEEEGNPTMKVLLPRNQHFPELHSAFERTTQDKLEREYALALEKRARDELARYNDAIEDGTAVGLAKGMQQGIEQGLAQGMAQGLAQGMAQGEAQAKRDVAKNLKNHGIDPEIISQGTGLSIQEIEGL